MLARKMKMVVAAIFFGAGAIVGVATVGNAQDAAQSNISKATVPAGSGTSMATEISPKTSAAPESSSADIPAWKEYKKILDNYYSLDKQKADHISCGVSFPELQGLIDHVRQEAGGVLIIDENPHDFSVTYDRTKGLSFNSPHIKVSVLPSLKSADDGQAENARKVMEKGINEVVVGEEKVIADIFAGMNMIPYSPEKQKNLSLTKNGTVTIVSFDEDENKHTSIIYSGTTQKHTNSSPTSNTTSILDYQPLNGKLALAHFVMEKTEGSTKTNGTESTSYQDLGSAFFPAQILYDQTISEGTQQLKPQHFEIDFKDCKTSDLSP